MTAEREAKALENVRDRLRIMADVYSEHAFADNLLSLASDIDAHLSRAAEPVGVAYVERLKAGYPTTAFPPSHPNAADMGNLYTHPPEPADAKDAEIAHLREVLGDLLSWFPAKPSSPEWRIEAGDHGADEAVEAARAAMAQESDHD